jgi:NTP pyrophosphatase (non-canonical NTP hydrolase)
MIYQHDLEAAKEHQQEHWGDQGTNMEMNAYQKAAAETAIYKPSDRAIYPALGLCGEAGEVANKVKKIMRDGTFDKQALSDEIGDVLWYLAALCRDLDLNLADVAMQNLDKLYDRKERGVLGGSGDKR